MRKSIPPDLQRQVKKHFDGYCGCCHSWEKLIPVTFEFDHIVPAVAGGTSTFENLALTCPTCNRNKGRRQSASDPKTGMTESLFHPQQQVWDEHFAWSEDDTQLIGLTPTGRATIEALQMNRPDLMRARKIWRQVGEHPPDRDSRLP
ncbi:HNH endonuclease [Gloeobacter kilaueensis]|uniref:HNH endonuclease n=1 Tax=Gloeobacter kilaueensis (strain ATCC BAA-2537 / CCAP 1431/1 / ULC 316 / JS1) TaxID=1183438 RepID=U5QGJ5_GLOK1|nr:HNH endonuclease [Gloeobacter kilaueensis JS1]